MRHILSAAIISLVLAIPCQSQDFDIGKQAFDNGEYAAAFAEWEPLAIQGDPFSQYGMGNLYEHGNGVKKDRDAAFDWYLRLRNRVFLKPRLLFLAYS